MTPKQRAQLQSLGFTPASYPGSRLHGEWENWALIRPGSPTIDMGYRLRRSANDHIEEPYWVASAVLDRQVLRMYTFDNLLVAVVALSLDPHTTDVAGCYIHT